jgi:hypothetical protein
VKAEAQNAPLISGGVGFLTSTNGGVTNYQPVISPVAAVPLGEHLLVESRAYLEENYAPKNGNTGPYQGDFFASLQYLQLDYIAAPKLTVTVGDFLTPFATYNERLTPIWISNFQDAPLVYPIGNQGGSSIGAMLRGAAFSNSHVQLNYVGYFSVASSVKQFFGERASGGRFSVYLPKQRTISVEEWEGQVFVFGAVAELLEHQHDLYVPSDSSPNHQPRIDSVMEFNNVSRQQAPAIVINKKLHDWSAALEGHLQPPSGT